MIHILDLNSSKNTHILFNVSMIKVLMRIYPLEQLNIHCKNCHFETLHTYFCQQELTRISHSTTPQQFQDHSKIKLLKKIKLLLLECKYFKEIINRTYGLNTDKIFILSVQSLSFIAFKYIKKISPTTPVFAIMHGELEFIYNATNNWEKMTGFLYKHLFRIQSPQFYYIFLNKISRSRLLLDDYLREGESVEIDHPYAYISNKQSRNTISKDTIKIGQVGSMGKRKNAHLLYQLANLNKNEINNGKLEFWTIGPVEEDVLAFKNNLVNDLVSSEKDIKAREYIPRKLYDEKVSEIDYAVFFYNETQFIFRASGAVHDVINTNKPLLVIQHPYFEYLFREAGNIGFICKNLSEMSDLLKKIASRDSGIVGQYKEQCENLELFKEKNTIGYTASDLMQQIERLSQ